MTTFDRLEAGTIILGAEGETFRVDAALADAWEPGDRIVAAGNAGLLRIPAAEQANASDAVARCAAAFEAMDTVTDEAIVAFFRAFAARLEDDETWQAIARVNAADVLDARSRGRSTTRLAVSTAMRRKMIEGLDGWATTPTRRDTVLETIDHDGFRIELVGAALGIVAFVFEGRPNVLADACGVLRGGNTVIFRIGSDALATAREIMRLAVHPALVAAGLPRDAITLIDSSAHAAGWALFLDSRVALAVARGSGPAVDLLGSLAQRVGTPVSLHGTGGAWMVGGATTATDDFRAAVARSLDRKVCNTLNVCCIVKSELPRLLPAFLDGLDAAAAARGHAFKLHVETDTVASVPAALFATSVTIARADGDVTESQAVPIERDCLGTEWEWEDSPEVSLVAVDSVDEATALFNRLSPRLVATIVTDDAVEAKRFYDRVRAPFVGDGHTRWVDGQFALAKPELGLSNWANGRLFGRGAILTGDSVYTVRTRYVTTR